MNVCLQKKSKNTVSADIKMPLYHMGQVPRLLVKKAPGKGQASSGPFTKNCTKCMKGNKVQSKCEAPVCHRERVLWGSIAIAQGIEGKH